MIFKKYTDNSKKKLKLTSLASIFLLVSLLFISIGYGSLSTTLSINGNAAFRPVGMIRVMSIEKNSFENAVEISSGYTSDTINVLIDLNESTSVATYNVNITNLGQVDKQLIQIIDDIYTNDDTEYIIDGFNIDDVIASGESRNFTITFKCKDGVTPESKRLNAKLRFVFDDYQDIPRFTLVFNHEGACTFNGSGNITGEDCSEYLDKQYIDTGISLFSDENWKKDFELGFTIENYNDSNQSEKQATFVNAKNEFVSQNSISPGLVFRRVRENSNLLEITEAINGSKVSKNFVATTVNKVRIVRKEGIIYYSVNDSELTFLQDMNDFNQQFDLTTWFGASPNPSGGVWRSLNATLSHMYIKLGTYQSNKYTIRFNPNGGTVSESSRKVIEGNSIGTLPTPTSGQREFLGWYADPNFTISVDKNTIVNSDGTYYAKWSNNMAVEIDGIYYSTLLAAINSVSESDGQKTIVMNEDVKENFSIPSGKNIVLDLQNHTLSNNNNKYVIENNATLKIINGTISTNSTAEAAINNMVGGKLEIVGVKIIATGTKQALYNKGGILTISGDSYLSSNSSIRATLHNLNNGVVTVTGGTIISNNQAGINNESGTMIIGVQDKNVSTTSPLIEAKTYGITSAVNYSLYDGIVKGKTDAVNNINKITKIEGNYEIKTQIDEEYKTLYLENNS